LGALTPATATLRTVSILGSTGSIGTQTLDVIARTPERFRVHSLAANTDAETVASQIAEHRPKRVAMADAGAAARLRERFPALEVLDGETGLTALASDTEADVVVNAVVGAAGLRATLGALDAGRLVALANKESCVAGGPLVSRRLSEGGRLVPVDSEHAATHMCLAGEEMSGVRMLVLTASGGPFRGMSEAELAGVTVDDALRHPTWSMGPKVTTDSATLMNKGLEVLEAHVLFGLAFDAIDVVCHPQSVVHCLVGFVDGSWKASLAPPDMRVPIAYAIGYPDRPDWGAATVDWGSSADLTFEPVDRKTFRCVDLAYQAGRTGGTAPAVLNAANEIAVSAFLDGAIGFPAIADVVERVLADGADTDVGYGRDDIELDDVLAADAWARNHAEPILAE
jgi:1-deoxy-D-xylulose-5-phosphate reductoisomerase